MILEQGSHRTWPISRRCKVIQDSLRFWIQCRGFWIPGIGFQIPCQRNLDCGLQSLAGFRISKPKICQMTNFTSKKKNCQISNSTSKNLPVSGFHKQNLLDSQFHEQKPARFPIPQANNCQIPNYTSKNLPRSQLHKKKSARFPIPQAKIFRITESGLL